MPSIPFRTTSDARLLVFLAVAVLAWPAHSKQTLETPPPWDWEVQFHPEDPTNDDYCPQSRANVFADAAHGDDGLPLAEPAGYLDGYVSKGFPPPAISSKEIRIEDFDGAPANANEGRIRVRADFCRGGGNSYLDKFDTTGHELFHGVQFAYVGLGDKLNGLGKYIVEGHAKTMEGKIFDTFHQKYLNSSISLLTNTASGTNQNAREYVTDLTHTRLWSNSYETALWWLFVSKEFGNDQSAPGFGIDFMLAFWQQVAANEGIYSGKHVLEQTLEHYGVDLGLKELFRQFAVTNLIRGRSFVDGAVFDESLYEYPQELHGNERLFGNVAITGSHDLAIGSGMGTGSVRTDAARYYEASLETAHDRTCNSGVVGFLGKRENTGTLGFTVVFVDDAGKVRHLYTSGAKGLPSGQFAATVPINSSSNHIGTVYSVVTGIKGEPDWSQQSIEADYSYTFACGPAVVDIQHPDMGATPPWPVYAGLPESPERITARVRVTGPAELSETSVLGLNKDHFRAWIGNESDPKIPDNRADVLSAYQVKGEYYLVIQPPEKPTAPVGSAHDLIVQVGHNNAIISQPVDTEAGSVIYDVQAVDLQLVIDHSGSMSDFGRMEAAKNAAMAYIDWAQSDDQIGVTRFDENADLMFQLEVMASQNVRDLIKAFIGGIAPAGATSIGDGLNVAWQDIQNNGRPTLAEPVQAEHWMLLLSDGYQNHEPWVEDVMPPITTSRTLVHAIALGAGSDQNLLQWIAGQPEGGEPTGRFEYIHDPEESSTSLLASSELQASRGISSTQMPLGLADAYRTMYEDMHNFQRLWETTGTGSFSHVLSLEEDNVTDMVLSLFWTNASEPMTLDLIDPNGVAVTNATAGARVVSDAQHSVVQLQSLPPGDWTIEVGGNGDFHAVMSGRLRDGVHMDLVFGQFHQDPFAYSLQGTYVPGLPMPIIAVMTDAQGPVTGAEMTADILHPSGSVHTLTLYDDGAHYDGVADDGVYANHYQQTNTGATTGYQMDPPLGDVGPGSYKVEVTAGGVNNSGRHFTRIKKSSFHLLDHPELDADQEPDGLPDRWEDRFGCVDSTLVDGTEDPDSDGLLNREELFSGTDPCNPDTDFGGEPDGSEVLHDRNPLLGEDDYLAPLDDLEVITHVYHTDNPDEWLIPNGLTLRFGLHPSYEEIDIYRRVQGQVGFNDIATINAQASGGIYLDHSLTAGTTYEYLAVPVALNGIKGAPSPIIAGTAKNDPVPPTGDIIIDDGRELVPDTNHDLSLKYSPDALEMRVSQDALFAGVPWQPVAPILAFTSTPDADNLIDIYVQYRDGEGNVSLTASDTTELDESQTFVSLQGSVTMTPGNGIGGLSGVLVIANGMLTYTDENGDFTLDNVPVGDYQVDLERFGYQSVPIEFSVASAARANVGMIDMYAIDSDNDGIWDIDEYLIGTDPFLSDTDGDGIQDGTELGWTTGVPDPDGDGSLVGTDLNLFVPDADPTTNTDPLDPDTDGDGWDDGVEDANQNGRFDSPGETDPLDALSTPLIFSDQFEAVAEGE